jgi:hypothetical protein
MKIDECNQTDNKIKITKKIKFSNSNEIIKFEVEDDNDLDLDYLIIYNSNYNNESDDEFDDKNSYDKQMYYSKTNSKKIRNRRDTVTLIISQGRINKRSFIRYTNLYYNIDTHPKKSITSCFDFFKNLFKFN